MKIQGFYLTAALCSRLEEDISGPQRSHITMMYIFPFLFSFCFPRFTLPTHNVMKYPACVVELREESPHGAME